MHRRYVYEAEEIVRPSDATNTPLAIVTREFYS
jgi:hypothetical protein